MSQHVILFDGVCNLCNWWVDFLLPRDKHKRFLFGALQSESGEALVSRFGTSDKRLRSVVLIEDEHNVYTRSTAILHILKILGGPWKLLYAFIIVPRPIRDAVYDFIALNRYSWFGKRIVCRVPTEGERERFV
ncbi:MAG: DUF393 domain-containing protein [Bacteroidetes bacterium]|nr:DUF393 domain-containing protein [Bacteroidota bacterium]